MGRFLLLIVGAVSLATPAIASPGDVDAESFYVEATRLHAKGMAAMFDKRTKPVMAQMRDAGETVKAENEAATRAGRPVYCVPAAARKKGIDADFIVDRLGRIPRAQRQRMTLKQAWRSVLVREYPCN